jgi:SAM-dependent methyltransferase/uncharacterized protein YbaR (Trm112 family)
LRLGHFEALKPVCPRCQTERQVIAPLTLATILKQDDEHIIEGVLHCSDAACQLEYPIIDGIPIIVPHIRKYLSENLYHINERDNLTETIESILGDAAGPGTFMDATRQHLSTYTWDHYHDLNPDKIRDEFPIEIPTGSSIVNCLDAGLRLVNHDPNKTKGPAIDIGCSVGRTSFELARNVQALTLGIDVNFSMLRTAHKVLREGIVQYPLKRIGIVYDRQEFKAEFANSQLVDFWACDALALPFAEKTFAFASAFNVFDSVTSPRDLLAAIGALLKPDGKAIMATPYDWSPAATPIETWIGGHSQRGPDHGAPEPLLKKLLTPGAHQLSIENLKISGEIPNHPWTVRTHSRSITVYSAYIAAMQSTKTDQ